MARKYRQLEDGEIRVLPGRRNTFLHKIRCCDCGLTHLILLRITSSSRAEFAAWRDRRATAAKRRRGS